MAQRSTIQSNLGATLAISATLPATYDAAGYGATGMVYTTIGEIEDFGEHGATAQITNFVPVATGVVTKVKGSIDYGTKSLVLAHVPNDAGQVILEAARASRSRYSVKITYPVGAGESTGEIQYLDVLVSKDTYRDGTASDVRKRTVDLALCRAPVIVDAT